MESGESDIITYYLEMTSAEQLRPARPPAQPFAVRRAELAFPALNRFFYTEVGRAYSWTNRMHWTDAQWLAWLERPGMQTWIGYVCETPAGYFELDEQRAKRNSQEAGSSLSQASASAQQMRSQKPSTDVTAEVELAYFGLLPSFIGRGVGGALLTEAIRRAWALGPQRVWLHTCTLDHPAALPNYQKRGFRIYDQKRNAE